MPNPASRESIPFERLRSNYERIRQQIAESEQKSGRPAGSVRLIAVTKYATDEETAGLVNLGAGILGESRIQETERKIAAIGGASLPAGVNWHLIGHLQTNKADKAAKLFSAVHSVDSLRVAQALDKEARKQKKVLDCLLEVNVAGEENKFGLEPKLDVVDALIEQCAALTAVRIAGLMTMAPYSENPEPTSRPVFRTLHMLFDSINQKGRKLTELSMGMTQDFQIAIEEGATMVRVGSALFE